MAEVTRNATVHWEGDVNQGGGNVDLASSHAAEGLSVSLRRARPSRGAARRAPRN